MTGMESGTDATFSDIRRACSFSLPRTYNVRQGKKKRLDIRIFPLFSFPLLKLNLRNLGLGGLSEKQASQSSRERSMGTAYGNGLVPCQGLDLGCVITKRPPLLDFAFRQTPIFRVDEALEPVALA